MDAAVRDQFLHGETRYLATHRIERGDDDGFRRVVHDDVHPREVLEGTDVPTLPADDPALHLIVREGDHGNGGFGRVVGRDLFDRHGYDVASLTLGAPRGLLLDHPHPLGRFRPRLLLHHAHELLLRFLRGQSRHALELAALLFHELRVSRTVRFHRFALLLDLGALPLQVLTLLVQQRVFLIEHVLTIVHPALGSLDLGPPFGDLLLPGLLGP